MMRRGLFRRWAGDQRGVAAVEFAILAPVLIFFYFGLAEFCQGYMAQKRMGHVSAMVADLVAQQEAVDPAGLDDIFAIGDLIMSPFPAGPLQQRVSSVTRGADGVARIDWIYGDDLESPGHDEGDTVTLPADLIANGESIIMSEVTYDYDSPVDHLLPATTQFSQTNYLRPRTVEMTACDAC